MERYTQEQRLQIIQFYYQKNRSPIATFRALLPFYRRNNRPSVLAIRRIVENFERTFSLHNVQVPIRRRTARSNENIAAVQASVAEDRNLSIPRRSQELGLSQTTTWRILRKDLGLHPYKIVLTQELKPLDHRKRREFADFALEQLENDNDFFKKIIFSDEAHFHLSGAVNKHNCRFWCEENPQIIHEKPLHSPKLTVWCGFWSGGIIGPYFFRNEAGNTVTVNGERYRSMITNFLWPKLEEVDLDNIWFQQDGATCHTATASIELLREKFGDSIISRNCDIEWPPRSCDLTPLDYFLWGYLKSLVFSNKPDSLQALQVNIERAIHDIRLDLVEKVLKNWVHRIRSCRRSRGGHLNDVLFRT